MGPADPSSEDQLIAQACRLSLEADQPQSHPTRPAPVLGDEDGGVCSISLAHVDAAAADMAADARRAVLDGHDSVDENRDGEGYPSPASLSTDRSMVNLEHLPSEILFHIFEFLDVGDLLSTSRTSHQLRNVSLTPLLHVYRIRRARHLLPPLLWNPSRPTLANLISRSIFLTQTSVVSRRLARSLVSIRLSRHLAARPSAEALVQRSVLPKECVPGMAAVHVAPSIVQRKKAVEKERIKDGLRRWIEGKWRGEVREREESQRRWEESRGIGRVWRLRRFWERIGRGDEVVVR